MHKVSAIAAGVVFLISTGAQAGTIDTVVVTATRTHQAITVTGDSISVLTAGDLAAQQINAVGDALAQTPDLTVVRYGGPGQTTTIGLRGAQAGQTVVLIDGVRVNDPSTVDDEAVLGDVLVNNIARIEVLRGPQSTLYGSDAIGGVVNILTKRGGASPFAVTASAEGGSFDTYHLNAAANGTIDAFDYGGAVNYFRTSGISAADARNGNREPDGTANLGLTLNARYHVAPMLSVDLRGYYTRARTDFDDNYAPPTYQISDSPVYEHNNLLALYGGLNLTLFDGRMHNRFAYIDTASRRTVFDSPFYFPRHEDYAYRGNTQRFEYQGIVDLSATDQLTFGAETERTSLIATTAGFADAAGHKRTTGYYLQGQTTLLDQLTVTGGVRYEDDAEFGGHTALKFAAAWSPDHGQTVLRANYGDGFKAPTLYQLYSEYSNPLTRLKPETSHGWEAGFDRSFWQQRIRASATYFERRTSDLIDFLSCYPGTAPGCAQRPYGYYYNVGKSRARGIEFILHAALTDSVSVDANYTNIHAMDEISHTDLARRPHNLASIHAQWQATADWSFGATALYVGRRFDGPGGATPLASHLTADLFVSHALSEEIELFGRIENLFDAHYEPVAGYGAPGRAVYAGVRVRE